jgi:iron(III) transport system substrate-binding protein
MTREQQLVEAAKANGEDEVVVWAMSWYYGPVEKAFQAKYPFLELKVWDPSGDALETKLIAEYKAGRHSPDVLQQPIDRIGREHAEGVVGEYEWPNAEGWPYQPPHNFWRVDQLSTRLPMYNTNLVSLADAPKSWEDLNDPKWQGKSIISTSGASWVLGFAYELGDVTPQGINWEPTIEFWKEVMETTKPRIGRGFQGPLEMLVAGDGHVMHMAAGTTGLYNIRRGAPIDFAPLSQTFGDIWTIALPKHPPHPNAARLFLDFITSDEGNLLLTDTYPNPTVNPRIADKSWANQYYKSRGIEIFTLPPELATAENFIDAARVWRQEIIGQ